MALNVVPHPSYNRMKKKKKKKKPGPSFPYEICCLGIFSKVYAYQLEGLNLKLLSSYLRSSLRKITRTPPQTAPPAPDTVQLTVLFHKPYMYSFI